VEQPRCPDCGLFLGYDAYYGRWTCSRCGRSLSPEKVAEERRLAAARASHPPETKLIGDRVCGHCDQPLFEHCHEHVPPCCPGRCNG
jgi:ribosomal protein S27AE